MSGIVSGIDYSVLFPTSTSSTTDSSSAILNALFSTASSSGAVSTGNPLTDLQLAQKNETRDVAQEAKDPVVARDIANYTKAVTNATDIKTALANPDVQKVLLTANGLSSYIGDTAFVQKVLLSDPNDPKSLVNQLDNSTWLNTVKAYAFNTNGLASLQKPDVISTTTNGYAEVKWRESLDVATPGLASALTFLSQASTFKTADDILGNSVARDVVSTAFGIPQQIAFQDLTAQEQAITSQLDISKLQDPKYVTALTDQYLLTKQQNAASSTDTADITSLAVQASGLVV